MRGAGLGARPGARGHRRDRRAARRPRARRGAAVLNGAALEVRGLTWRPAGRRLPTIDHLDFHVPPGQRVLLAGASGSGKSTVLRALAGLLDPSTGDLEGQVPPGAGPGERGMLLQRPEHALVGATIGRDAAFGPENLALERAAIQERVREALTAAAVDLDADRRPLEASGGQQQRIALAGALALRPGALLLDEPTSMLDPEAEEAVRAAILAVSARRTLVIAEHRIAPWLDHVDRLVVLGPQARVIADGPPDRLLEDQRALLSEAGLWLPGEAGAPPGPSHPPPCAAVPPVARLRDVAVRARGPASSRPVDRPLLAHDLCAELAPGSLTAVTGPSGAGKTSLLRVVLGLDAPAAGRMEAPPRDRIAWVPQEPEHSFVAASVWDEVLASPRVRDAERAERLLDRAGLAPLSRANPYAISGGEQRRLALVAALAAEPTLLVLDEPTVGLDRAAWEAVLDLLREAREAGCAVLAATHDAALVERSDAVLRLGRDSRGAVPGHTVTPGAVLPPDPSAPGPSAPAHDRAAPGPDRTIRPIRRHPRAPADALNPLVALTIAFAGILGSLAVTTWQVGLTGVVPLLLLAPLTVRTARGTVARLALVLLSAGSLAWSTALLSSAPALSAAAWLLGAKEALRILVFVGPGVLILGCVDPTSLGDALGDRWRLPGRVVAASVAGLVRAGHLAHQWDLITTARTLRGLGPERSARHPLRTLTSTGRFLASSTFALLVDALRGAGLQALAMDARGFAQARRRTWALPSRFTRADALGAAAALLVALTPWIAAISLR